MPFTLWRYAFWEVLRLVVLSTAVLVTVIAFAAAVKPLADGKLEPGDALKFMVFAVPPMLAYALPFAAGFGSTLAYHRLATDRELVATRAGGLSQRKMLIPALAAGFMLTAGLTVLNEQVIPRFLRQMEELITQDLTKIMATAISRGESVRLGDLMIYADEAVRLEPDRGAGVLDQLVLVGVWAIELDDEREVSVEAAVSRAQVAVMTEPAAAEAAARAGQGWPEPEPDPTRRFAVIRLLDGDGVADGQYVRFAALPPIFEPLDDTFQDDPKFLTWQELRDLRDAPAGMNWIDRDRARLARALAIDESIAVLADTLERDGRAELFDADGRVVVISNARLGAGGRLTPREPGGSIRVEQPPADGGPADRAAGLLATAPAATIGLSRAFADSDDLGSLAGDRLRLDLVLETARVGRVRADGTPLSAMTERATFELARLTPPADPLPTLMATSTEGVLALAEERGAGRPDGTAINQLSTLVRDRVSRLRNEILSKQHERLAMSAACLVMVVLGAVMAIRLQHAVPLAVYLWSFFPALATVLLISTGQQLVHRNGVIALPVLWSGVVLLAGHTLVMLRLVSKH